jgi:hypothetical protein
MGANAEVGFHSSEFSNIYGSGYDGKGAAIVIDFESTRSINIENSRFELCVVNRSGYGQGGAIYFNSNAGVSLLLCEFVDCSSTANGGGVVINVFSENNRNELEGKYIYINKHYHVSQNPGLFSKPGPSQMSFSIISPYFPKSRPFLQKPGFTMKIFYCAM